MRLSWLLFFFNTLIRVEDKRMSDRFDMVHIKTTPVRIALPVNSYDMSSIYVQEMFSSTAPMLRHMNYTINMIRSYGIGYRTAYGNYTAFLGSLMDNTSDFAFYGTPLGGFDYPGLAPGPVMSGLSLRIYSQVGKNVVVRGDALDTFIGLPLEVKLYIAAAVHIIACCMSPARRKFFSGYLQTTWHSVLNYLDQENYAVKSTIRRILWLSFNVFAFVSMFGYILNLMSTDAFVALPPRRIEALEDVFDSYFMDRNIRYHLTTNDFFFNYVLESKPGTAIHKLYKHMNSTNDCTRLETCNFLEIHTGKNDSLSRQQKIVAMLQEKSEKDDSALFVTSQLADSCIIPAICRIKPDWMNKLFVSPHTVVEDILMILQRDDLGTEIDLTDYTTTTDNMRLPWLLFLFNTVIRVEDKRLTDRFDMVHIKTTPVRVALPVNTYDMSNLHVQEMLSSTTPMLKHMNFTINVIKSYGVGYRTAHGNYTAFLGSLMENTSDFAFYGTPLGSFSYPGLVPGPVMSGLSLRIYSQIGKSVVVRGDVLDTFKGLPVEVKLYIAAAVHIIACCMSPASRKFFSGYLDTTWHSVLGYLDQENYAVKSTTRRILWLSFNVFAFVSMFGYILNLMSTDAFVALPPRRIEAIKDVFDQYFMIAT
ncbi:hypothetical protein HDE_14094 [Halotydeus destructor]|nr:hypothetical protein HDE_14094 [Halotydeus destructor]